MYGTIYDTIKNINRKRILSANSEEVMIKNGIDSVEISRIERFKRRVYGSDELKELENKKAESFAGAFCAKEAFSKALGTGVRGFSLCEVQVLHDGYGAPYFSLSGNAEKIAREKGLEFSLSITHTDTVATASVIAYGGTKND